MNNKKELIIKSNTLYEYYKVKLLKDLFDNYSLEEIEEIILKNKK